MKNCPTKTRHALLPALMLAAALGSASLVGVAAAEPAASPPPPPPAEGAGMDRHDGPGGPHGRWGEHARHWGEDHRGPLEHLLHKLDLSEAQKGQIKAIFERSRTDMHALQDKNRATHESLAGLSPQDPKFGALVETAKANAAARVQHYADVWTKVYGVLTPAQQAKIPAILAEEQQARAAHEKAREAHEKQWQEHHDTH